jgi:hypothetical protein
MPGASLDEGGSAAPARRDAGGTTATRKPSLHAEACRVAAPPDPLTLERHRDLGGLYTTGLVVRRIGYALIGAVAILGLFNVFGQQPSKSRAHATAATFEVSAPSRLRGGLLYMARFRITAKQDLKKATLVLDPGWAENITINTIEPAPTDETSDNGRLSFELGPVPAGDTYALYMEFQVNPTNVGRHSQDVELRDGDRHIAAISRTATVFP